MDHSLKTRRRILVLGLLLVAFGGVAAAYFLWPRPLPEPGSPKYVEYVRGFQGGVAALDTEKRVDLALARLDQAIATIPEEPAAWANRGLLYLRRGDTKAAAKDLKRAHALAPNSGEIEALLGELARQEGRPSDAVAHLRKALEKDPRNVMTLYALAEIVSGEGAANSEAEYLKLMDRILEVYPNNLHVLMKRAGAAHRGNDAASLGETLKRLDRLAPTWKPRSQEQLAALHKAVDSDSPEIAFKLTILSNVLQGETGYARETAMLKPKAALIGTTLQYFLRLKSPRATPASPDRSLTFSVSALPTKPESGVPGTRWDSAHILWRIEAAKLKRVDDAARQGGLFAAEARVFTPAMFVANGKEVRSADADGPTLPFPGGAKPAAPSPAGVLAIDFDNDLRLDLLFAGAAGLRFLQQKPDGSFDDITQKTSLPAEVLGANYYGAWAADVDMDGDLDIIVARRVGPPLMLRNNGDGTFKAVEFKEFAAVEGARAFVWADLDNDGAPDAVFLDAAGKLHVFANERSAQLTPWPLPKDVGTFAAITVADVNDDGLFDIVGVREKDGALVRISDLDHRKSWQTEELAKLPSVKNLTPGSVSLFAEDLDNNGALDLIVAGPEEAHIFLADEQVRFQALSAPVALRVFAVIDLNGDGRLDLVGLSGDGQLCQARSAGARDYRWQVLRPLASRAAPSALGDSRLNSFAVGGEIEVRSGLLVQKQRITGPMVHFGLGEQTDVNVVRIIWPNGEAQWEFELPADPYLVAAQRLSGSCPFLFTFDGTGMRFAGDFMWNTPLGMSINGQTISSFEQTTEWLKIRGEHLVPKDGYYDLRVHANLWETDYFDQLALIVVDHPPDTEIYVDERFFLTPTAPKLYVTTPVRPVARAWDHLGQDATELVTAIDGRYLDRAGRGKYQGVTNDHWVMAELPDDAPTEGPVYLVARGWIHPTNSSINVALAQGKHDGPQPLVLEVPDGKGGWKVGRPALGFPAGKDKTILIRLDGIDGPGVCKRFRLRTNMEIYWDFLGYARGLDAGLAKLERPAPQSAELRYRGILEMTQKDASSPEVPHYDKVMRGIQPWRDLTGWYTRFGDVRELVARVDDRYVIANAGDEIAFRFPVPAGPPPGWKRDFIWECDGWTRDGNPNTRFGTTVLPLPAHGLQSLDRPPGQLEDDPVYRQFPRDWETYHTRYVTPAEFERGLRTFRTPKK